MDSLIRYSMTSNDNPFKQRPMPCYEARWEAGWVGGRFLTWKQVWLLL